MYRVIAVAVLALIFACPGLALAKPGKEKPVKHFQSAAELLQWINGYRRNPEPKRVPDAVKAMSAFGATKDMDQAGVYIGFVAGVLGANPDTAEDLVTQDVSIAARRSSADHQGGCLLRVFPAGKSSCPSSSNGCRRARI